MPFSVINMPKAFRSQKEKEIQSDIFKLRHNISRRLTRIEKSGTYTQYYEKIKSDYEQLLYTTKGLDISQLRTLRQELRYINSLKSTTIKGSKETIINQEKLKDLYKDIEQKSLLQDKDALKDEIKKINALYNRLVEENGIWEKFKYQIKEDISYLKYNRNMSEVEIYETIKRKLDDLYIEYDEDASIEDYITEEAMFDIFY